MKNILTKTLYLLTLALLVFSCDEPLNFLEVDSLDVVNNENVPTQVYEFLDQNFPDYAKRTIKREDICIDSLVFEAELEHGNQPDVDVYFKENGDFWFIASKLLLKDLPADIQERIDTLAADLKVSPKNIEIWEFSADSVLFKLELRSKEKSLDVLVTTDGTIICLDDDSDHDDDGDDDDGDDDDGDDDDGDDDDGDDDDGDDDDGDDDDGDDDDGDDDDGDDDDGDDDDGDDDDIKGIPAFVRKYIDENYPDYSVEEVEVEDICDDERYHAVELEDGSGPDIELYFSLDWTFQFSLQEIEADDLSDAVVDVVNTDYADYQLEADDISRLQWSDGTVMFEVELEHSDNDDLEIIFNEDGSIYCEE